MIPINANLQVANTLLSLLDTIIPTTKELIHQIVRDNDIEVSKENMKKYNTLLDFSVQCFDNCREQGYVLKIYGLSDTLNIAFSENRNSDEIVIYCYKKTKFPSNLPDENCWDDKKYFSYDKYFEAGEYILKRIKEQIKEDILNDLKKVIKK